MNNAQINDLHTTRFIVSSTDRQRKRSIQADSPGEAVATFLGSRCATFRCTSSSFDGTEFWYGASVTAYTGEYRRSHPVKNIHVYVSEHHPLTVNAAAVLAKFSTVSTTTK